MKNLFYILSLFILFLPSVSFTQDISDSIIAVVENRINLINQKVNEKGYRWKAGITSKSFLTKEEMSKLCGLKADTSKRKDWLQRSDSLYIDYKTKKKSGLLKTMNVPDWQGMMSHIEEQECGNCWAHAATGATSGLLHNFYGSNIGIDLDEMDITNNASCGNCSGTPYLDCGLSYIYSYKVRCEQGINQFPNYDHAYYTVSSYSNNTASISAIKSSLESSPVVAGMAVYEDFAYDYDEGIYEYVEGEFLGYHAVVILGYNDDDEYWLCRNSWGTDWGEAGYFRIAYGECGIDAMGNVTASISSEDCFAKLIPNFNALSDAMEYAFVDDEWVYILNNITINNGDNVNVPSNTFLAFTNNITLTINGSLYINGTYSSPVSINRFSVTGSFGGIIIGNGGSADIDYANIQNATTGVKFESGSSGSVSNSTLSNNTYGIYISGAEPTIEGNTISSNSYGIYVTNSYSPSWTVEHIKNNSIQSNSAYGLYLYNSSPTLSGNAVSGCNNGTALFTNCYSKVYDNDFVSNSNYGFACYGSSSPSVYYNTNYSFGGYNSFLSNNSDEVRITGSSNPNFGNYFFEGNNSFDDNSGYLMYNSTGSTISAENNWWGSSSGPGVNQIYGSVDYDPYLDEDPNNPSRAIFIDNPSLAVSSVNSTEDLSNAFNAYYGGNFTLAASLFKEYLNQNPKSENALEIIQYYLQSLNMFKTRTDMLSDIDLLLRLKLDDNVRNEAVSLYAAYLELNGNYDEALLQLESLMGKETEDEFKNRVKLQKAYLLINTKEDTVNAKALFEEVLQNVTKDSYLFEIASAELNNLSKTKSVFPQALAKTTDLKGENRAVSLKNYPNPFNSETIIKFSLPNESDVEMDVYNILGQKVAALVNDKLSAGQHSVKLNASSFASGIYIYTLRTDKISVSRKILLVK